VAGPLVHCSHLLADPPAMLYGPLRPFFAFSAQVYTQRSIAGARPVPYLVLHTSPTPKKAHDNQRWRLPVAVSIEQARSVPMAPKGKPVSLYRVAFHWGLVLLGLTATTVEAQVPRTEKKPTIYLPPKQQVPTQKAVVPRLQAPPPILPTGSNPDSVLITFEDITSAGPSETGAVAVGNHYAGIAFINTAWVLDYSRAAPVPGFARSGTHAIVLCTWQQEICTDSTFQIRFDRPQERVSIWAGVSGRGPAFQVALRAYSKDGVLVASKAVTIDSGMPPHIGTQVEVRADSNQISFVTVTNQGANGMEFALDDVEFQRATLESSTPAPVVDSPVGPTVVDSTVLVPSVTGLTPDSAASVLRAARLGVGMQGQVRVQGQVGTVWTQHPGAGEPARLGDLVNLDIVIGPPPPPPPWWLVPIAVLVAAAAWWKLRKPRPQQSPIPSVVPHLVGSGLDGQEATFAEVKPSPWEIGLRVMVNYPAPATDLQDRAATGEQS